MAHSDLVVTLLREPGNAAGFSTSEWDLLVRQARHADVMGQLHARLSDAGQLGNLPEAARRHLDTAWNLSQRHRLAVRWELLGIANTLAPLNIPVVLLKGAAYYAAGRMAARGRLFTDVDILVPKAALDSVERIFIRSGWVPTHLNAYDQRYYRQWMHELPPMQHARRGTLIDIHHTLLPPTTGVNCDAAALIAAAQPLEDAELAAFKVLAPSDMLLHSATHLFYGEFDRGLRELVDLDQLIRELGTEPDFWAATVDRARQLDLLNPLHHAVRYTHLLLGTPIPDVVLRAPLDPTIDAIRQRLLDALFLRAFRPDHVSCNDAATRLARWLAFVRSHWLRMPVHLLVPHLFYKAVIAPRKEAAGA
ncbi:MAG: nucleotidyltransferase family protein [Pseudomonadota bacterium]|nr:nucleotidyltransferase family protein [Pseudomonadota bacterium]